MSITPITALKNARAAMQLLELDPATLGIRDQARADATPDDELVASVRQFGIMQPPTVEYDADEDKHYILMGHRRVGAAIAAGINPITVILRPDALADEAITLERQIVENERRKALTASEVTQGYKKLELFGRTPEDIAAELGEKPERIRAGLRVAASEKTSALVDATPSLNLEQAAIIAEFDDNPKFQDRLVTVAEQRPANFNNEVHAVRREQELADKLRRMKAQAKDAGIPVAETLTYDGGNYWSGRERLGATVDRLSDQDGNQLTVQDHAGCPGAAIIITGAWSIDNIKTIDVCTSWEFNGHQKHTPTIGREKTQEDIDRDAEWERAAAEREKKHEAVQENTRARREWLHGFLGGRLNQTAGIFDIIATGLIVVPLESQDLFDPATTIEILTGERPANWDEAEKQLLASINNGKLLGLRALAATALAALELTIPHRWGTRYLEQLKTWGYQLTDIDLEQITANAVAEAEDAAEDDFGDDEAGDDE